MSETGVTWEFARHAWLPLAGFLLNLGLGIFVWSRNWRSLLHRTFAALNVAAALWNLDVFLLFTLRDAATAGLVDRLLQVPIVALPFLGLFFIFVFLERKLVDPVLLLFGLWTLCLCLITFRPDYITGWERHWFGFYGRAGRLYVLFPLTHLLYFTLSTGYLWAARRRSRSLLRRNQTGYLLLANIMVGLISLHNFGPLYGGEGLPLGNVAALFYFLAIAVTIVKYRLLDIEVFVRYGLVYSVLTFVLSALYFMLIMVMQSRFRLEIFSESSILPMLPALALAFAFGPVKNIIQKRIDRRFFRCRTLLRERLSGFSAGLREMETEDEIWAAALAQGWSVIGPRRALVQVRRGEGFVVAASEGDVPLTGDGVPVVRESDFELEIPLEGKEDPLGRFFLGPRKGGDPYRLEEVSYARSIADQAALAVERVRLHAQIRDKERLAMLGRAAAVVSHELRSPLSVIKGAMALLRSRGLKEGHSLVSAVEDEIRRGENFIREFLSACREPVSRPGALDLGLLLEECLARWPRESYPGLNLSLDVPEGGVRVSGDPFHLSRLFENLVRNAAEAARGRCRLDIRCEPAAGSEVMLTFADNGPGIETPDLSRLFEPFFTTRKMGTGLGLSIVKGIVDAHRGRIVAGNGPAGGAVIRVWLPAA